MNRRRHGREDRPRRGTDEERPKFVFQVPPEAEELGKQLLGQVLTIGKRAIGSAVESFAEDVREAIKKADERVEQVQKNARRVRER